jgi:sugar lactone lactonase YvrE
MFVGPEGRAYVDAYDDHTDLTTQRLLLVTVGEEPVVVAEDLTYPNGLAVTPDGGTLLISETFAGRISAFDVQSDGRLGVRRIWASLPKGTHPDGLCLDANLDVWVASFRSGEFLHVRERGEVVERVVFPGRWALSCSLGGVDGRTLLMCTAETTQSDYFAGRATGFLDTRVVEVPGVQRP